MLLLIMRRYLEVADRRMTTAITLVFAHAFGAGATSLVYPLVRNRGLHRRPFPECGPSRHWFRLMSDPHEAFCWTSRWGSVMRLCRAISLSAGEEDDDLDPQAMPLLSWEERRGTAHRHHAMWRTTDPVPLGLLCTDVVRNPPSPSGPVENAMALVVHVLAALTEGGGINAATRLYGGRKKSLYRWHERLRG